MIRIRLLILSMFLFLPILASGRILYLDPRYQDRIPLWFDVVGKNLELKPLELEWDLTDPAILSVGDIRFDADSVLVLRGQPRALLKNPKWMQGSIFGIWDDEVILLQWPLGLFEKGQIEAISRSGRTILSWPFDSRDLEIWEPMVETGIKRSAVAIRELKGRNRALSEFNQPFRFCISDSGQDYSSRLCSSYMRWPVESPFTRPDRLEIESKRVRVIINQQEAEVKGRRIVDLKKIVSFYAASAEGISYEFFARPKVFELIEAYENSAGKMAIVATGSKPSVPTKTIRKYVEGEISQALGWQSTIGDFREFWEAEIPKDQPILYVPGQGAGVFRQEFDVKELPKESQRIFLDNRTPTSTYLDSSKLYLMTPKGLKPKTKQNSAMLGSDGETVWKFRARDRGGINQAKIQFEGDGKNVDGQLDLYKGFPGELSIRLGVQYGSNGDLILLGEGAASYWFENILGWNNYWFGRHRWGLTSRYSRTFSEFKIKEKIDDIDFERVGILQSSSLDLKYRLSSGLWGRDETWGIVAGVDLLRYDDFSSNRLGMGILWARSMPKVIDEIFNLVTFMQYPKFVDVELVLYPTLVSSPNVSTIAGARSTNFNLNFHGKILWNPRFYGEMGFGLRSIYLRRVYPGDEEKTAKDLNYFGLHGTAGLGLNF